MTDPLSDAAPGPRELREPGQGNAAPPPPSPEARKALWLRGLWMLVLSATMGLALAVLNLLALVQFLIMLIEGGRPNAQIAGLGRGLGAWLARATRFMTGESEDKPWPWAPLD